MRASIIDAITVPLAPRPPRRHPLLLNGVDADMLTETSDYFRKLSPNLDRMIEQAGSRRDNAADIPTSHSIVRRHGPTAEHQG